jgi:glycosyltransferase involved in cell wall biosynthesis
LAFFVDSLQAGGSELNAIRTLVAGTLEREDPARPVVATAVGGKAEAVEPNRTGLLVPPGDPQALTAALRFFLESGERRSAFGTAGQQRARLLFHSDVVLAKLSSWYARALANG